MNQPIHSNWYSTFFNGLIVDMWTRANNPEQTRLEAEFIRRHLDLPRGARIADVPCGDGRLSIALSKAGYRLQGIDISPGILEAGRKAANDAGVTIELREGDVLKLPWTSELDGAFCFGNSFGYFDDSGNEYFLSELFRSLKLGGRVVLQSNLVSESILSKPLARSWYQFGDLYFLHAPSYDPGSATITSEYTLIRNGDREEKTAHFRVYSLRDLTGMMAAVGFGRLQVFGGLNDEVFKLGNPSVYIVAEK